MIVRKFSYRGVRGTISVKTALSSQLSPNSVLKEKSERGHFHFPLVAMSPKKKYQFSIAVASKLKIRNRKKNRVAWCNNEMKSSPYGKADRGKQMIFCSSS